MPIDTTAYSKTTETRHTVLREWNQNGHAVAWMRYEGINIYDEPYEGEDLYCECDFEHELEEYQDKDGNKQTRIMRTRDSFHCEAKDEVRELLKQEARGKHLKSWRKMGTKRATYNIFRRVQKGEYLGQRYPSIIYVQEVAELLKKEEQLVRKACAELFKEEKMDLNGAILSAYVKRFRFPKEIQQLLRYIIEEPLGWPNGDAGDGFVYALEEAIHENTNYKHGKDAFWEENYPNLSWHHLTSFGLRWLVAGISRLQELEEVPEYINSDYFEHLALDLEKIAQTLRGMSS